MAAGLNISALTLNAKENPDFSKFISEQVYQRPELRALHTVFTGLTMKEQIVLASQFGKTGLKGDATCTRKTSGAKSTLTQKYWEPAGIEDTLVHCQAELNGLFKAYSDKITAYRQKYDISGTDEEVFLSILFEESMTRTIWRAIWLGDKAVAAAGAAAAGLISAGNVGFYDYFDGLWKQSFAAVTAGSLKRYTIALNAQTTKANQLALTAGLSVTYFEAVWALADPRLKAAVEAQFLVTGAIFENYRQYLQSKGENFSIGYTMDGLQTLKWNGKNVVNMETIWDLDIQADFVDNTTNNAYYLPNRIMLTTPSNTPIGTLNEGDFNEIEVFYDQKPRELNMGYGFSLDAKLVEEYMAVVAY